MSRSSSGLLDFLDKAGRAGLIQRQGSGVLGPDPNLREDVRQRIEDLNRPERVSATVEALKDRGLLVQASPETLARLLERSGCVEEAAGALGVRRSQALIRLHLGRFSYRGDRRMEAVGLFDTGRAAVEELGDEDIRARAAELIGLYYFTRGLHPEAIGHLARATQAFETWSVNPSAPLHLGYCAAFLGQFHRAVGSLDFSWRRAKRNANQALAASYRAALCTALLLIKKTAEGLAYLHAALEEAQRSRNALARYSASGGLAYHHFVSNRSREARDLLARLIAEGAAAGIRRQFASPYVLAMPFEFHRLGLDPIPGFGFQDQVARVLGEPSVHLRGVALRLRTQESLRVGEELVAGTSPAMSRTLELADRAARSDGTVLTQGETGVGKERLAHRLHERSRRSRKLFVTVDPTTIPENLMESELFGYEKGAFTGADSRVEWSSPTRARSSSTRSARSRLLRKRSSSGSSRRRRLSGSAGEAARQASSG